jgi:hypothetical protein
VQPASWERSHSKSQSVHLKHGYDYCVSVRARNWAKQVTGWTTKRCLTRHLDDRALSASAGWKFGTGSAYLGNTYTGTKTKGATLRAASAQVRRIGILATTCATCGKVAVIVGGQRIATINLYSASAQTRTLLMLPRFSRHHADVVFKVKSTGLKVRIDGVVISRT